jgi:hypothetical protein
MVSALVGPFLVGHGVLLLSRDPGDVDTDNVVDAADIKEAASTLLEVIGITFALANDPFQTFLSAPVSKAPVGDDKKDLHFIQFDFYPFLLAFQYSVIRFQIPKCLVWHP